uniref:Uncharacterized protein n=1 Tax=Timema cristinae TaxID=61476 RepID=A0A7R9H6M9_TIMCR|nr:unnamed protein product [Timema cristinae]
MNKFNSYTLRFAKEVGSIIGTPMVIEFVDLTLIICFQFFEAVTKEKTFFNTFKFVNTAIVALSVLYIYCRLGENVKTWSSRMAEAVYDLDWFQECPTFKKTCLVILIRTHKPIVLQAGPFYTISLEAFLKTAKRASERASDWVAKLASARASERVINTAYSYFTIMMQINKK